MGQEDRRLDILSNESWTIVEVIYSLVLMLLYKHRRSGLTFGCSYKVMSSFFLANSAEFDHVAEVYSPNPKYPVDYFLVRNPYDRIKSLFVDKLRVNIDRHKVQFCQLVIMHHFKMGDVEELKTISFSQFCYELPYFYKGDAHFYSQECGYDPKNVGQVIKIETELSKLPKLNVDFHERNHPSSSCDKQELRYNRETSLIINVLHSYDFGIFGYNPQDVVCDGKPGAEY